MKRVKGFSQGRRKLLREAKQADTHAGMHAYRDRRVKKRTFRALWQIRINAAARMFGMSYSSLTGKLKEKHVGINRKVLSEIAAEQPTVFAKIVDHVK